MIRFSGRKYARVRVEHVLDRDDAARLLLKNVLPWTREAAAEMSIKDISRAIRSQLADNADAANWVSDDYSDEYPHELTFDEAMHWAAAQVAKLP